MKVLRKSKFIILSALLIAVMTLGIIFTNVNSVSAAIIGYKTTDTNTTISASGDSTCPVKVKFNGGLSNTNFVASVDKANLTNYEMVFDFTPSQKSDTDEIWKPWAFLYFSATQTAPANVKSSWISFSVDGNSGDIRVHYFENKIETDCGCGFAPAIVGTKTDPKIKVKISIQSNNLYLNFTNLTDGTINHTTSCALSTFTNSTRCNFDPTSCYICVGDRFANKAGAALVSEFYISDPFAKEPIDPSIVPSGVEGFEKSGKMGLSAVESTVNFSMDANDTENSAFISTGKYHVNTFNWTLNITEGFNVNGSEIFFALKANKTLWQKDEQTSVGYDGLYLIIKRTAENKLSFSVYFYKQDSENSSYANHQRGNVITDVPFDTSAKKIEVKIERDETLNYFNVFVNGKGLIENLTVNEFKNAFGGDTVSNIKGHLLVQIKSNNEKVAGNMTYIVPEGSANLSSNAIVETYGENVTVDAETVKAASQGCNSGITASIGFTVVPLLVVGVILIVKRKKESK